MLACRALKIAPARNTLSRDAYCVAEAFTEAGTTLQHISACIAYLEQVYTDYQASRFWKSKVGSYLKDVLVRLTNGMSSVTIQ